MTSFRSICTASALTVFVMGSWTQGFASAPHHPATSADRSASSIKLAATDSFMSFVDYNGDYDDDYDYGWF